MSGRNPTTVGPKASAWHVADQMDADGVGSVVVIDESGAPVGIITDRDLVRRVVAKGLDGESTTAAEIMTQELVTGNASEEAPMLLELMRKHRVRRIPLLRDGKLESVLSLDDLLGTLSSSLWNVSEAIRVELRETARTTARRRRSERRAEMLEEARQYLRDVRATREEIGQFSGFIDWLGRGPS